MSNELSEHYIDVAGILSVGDLPTAIGPIHESLLRAYHILGYVEQLLAAGTPGPVAYSLLVAMSSKPQKREPDLSTGGAIV